MLMILHIIAMKIGSHFTIFHGMVNVVVFMPIGRSAQIVLKPILLWIMWVPFRWQDRMNIKTQMNEQHIYFDYQLGIGSTHTTGRSSSMIHLEWIWIFVQRVSDNITLNDSVFTHHDSSRFYVVQQKAMFICYFYIPILLFISLKAHAF